MNQKRQVEDLMAKYLSGNITGTEREKLLVWVENNDQNRSFFEEMIQLWAASADYDNDFQTDVGKAWRKVAAQVDIKPTVELQNPFKSSPRFFIRNRILLRVAAAVLFLVIATYWWTNHNEMIIVQTAINENTQIKLPDGSKVWLNQNSQISYHRPFKKRDINLKGEAFFDVARDENHPFTIASGATKTKVLGTSFNVRAYPDDREIIVTVSSGRVEFQAQNDPTQKVILKVNEAGIFIKKMDQLAKTTVTNENATSWKTQKLSFNNTPLKQVFDTMERHFGINFEVKNKLIWQCEFFGSYDNPKLDDLLEAMNFSMGLSFEKKGNHYIVTGGKGCGKK